MNKLFLTLVAFTFMAGNACAAGAKASPKAKAPAQQYKSYAMDKDYFTCSVPGDWNLKRDAENDEEYKIYEIQLVAPKSEKTPTSIFVSYYAKDSDDFAGYQDFVNRNIKNVAGETKSSRESYEPPKKIKMGGREAFELNCERMVYLHPESKTDESVQLKEKHYVLPAKEGFYVLHFTAAKTLFAQYAPVFEKVAKSFKPKF